MKILYHHRIASKDGQYVHVEELTEALKKKGHEIIFVCPSSINKEKFGSDGGLVSKLKKYIPGLIYELLEFLYNIIVFSKLVYAYYKYKPDCIYERYNLFLVAGIWVKKLFNLPMLLEVNSPLYEERGKYDGICLKKLAKWTESYAWRNADIVLPVTEVLAKIIHEIGVPRENIVVIPNGIDLEKFIGFSDTKKVRDELGIGENLVLGFTGFVRPWHGLDRIVEFIAAKKEDNYYLVIVGDGPAINALKEQASELGVLDKVIITGIIDRKDVVRYISIFDIALQPDVVEYASPLKLFEYLAIGSAIIAPNKENIREVLTHDLNAYLFEADSKNSFTKGISKFCSDSEYRKKISINSRKLIDENGYTWMNNAEKVISLFKRLLNNL